MKQKNNLNRSGLHKASIGLLTAGMVIAILVFVFSVLGLLGYSLVYFGGILVFLMVVAIIYLILILTTGVLFGLINFIIIFIEAFFSALANSGSTSFDGVWPDIDWNLISPSTWETFGLASLIGAIILPLLIIFTIASLIAMIFAIVALTNVKKAQNKKGMITGGVFAILSALGGQFSLLELVGGILAFIPKIKEEGIIRE